MARTEPKPPPKGLRAASLDDAEVARAVLSMPRQLTHRQVAARLASAYGAARAWSTEMVRQYCLTQGWPPKRGRVEQDPTLRAFVDDRLGRASLDAIVAAAGQRFGAGAVSRSALHRYLQRERERQAQAASEATT